MFGFQCQHDANIVAPLRLWRAPEHVVQRHSVLMSAPARAGYVHELTHGQFNEMTLGEKVGTAAAGLVAGGILYEARGCSGLQRCMRCGARSVRKGPLGCQAGMRSGICSGEEHRSS